MRDPIDPSFDRRRPFLAHRLRERYTFVNLLGRGGTGTVYEVRNLRLDRIEALKVLGESLEGEAAERFAQEARVAASLNHPRIVKIHDFGMEEGVYWYSMDLVDGPTLEGLLDDRGPFELSTFAKAMIPMLDALDYAHGLGIIHRDLKPANILVNHEGRPYLADFGVAKSKENLLKTQTGLFLGTPAYIAPEQALTGGADLRADIYSMGAMMYHLLSGRMPFHGDTPLQIVVARLNNDATPIQELCPGLPEGLAVILATAMARDRDLRYATAGLMRDALRRFCQDAGVAWEGPITSLSLSPCARIPLPPLPASEASPPGPVIRKPLRIWPWALCLAGILAVAGFELRPKQRRPAPAPPPFITSVPRTMPLTPKEPAKPALPSTGALAKVATKVPAKAAATVPVPASYPQLEQSFPPEGAGIGACAGRRVILTLTVGEDGSVQACRVLSDAAPACADTARRTAMRYRFKPALDAEGHPIKAVTTIALEFPEGP
jgi:serine/threonine-protein kinase